MINQAFPNEEAGALAPLFSWTIFFDTIVTRMPLSLTSLAWVFDWAQSPTWRLMFLLILNIIWVPMLWWLFQEIWEAWLNYVAGGWASKRKYVYLAVDVPKDTEQTPSGMEAIFNQLAGAHGTMTEWEKFWEGVFQESFSCEIVSIDGYVQYIIRAPKDQRDLVEAAIYAQYPDAEISEVRDYATDVPMNWPNEDWDFFATEYLLAKPDAYPIRTYREFEDKVRGELIDPMSAMLEIMSKIGKGEQIWYQVIVKPIVDPDWVPAAQAEIDRVVEKEGTGGEKAGILRGIANLPVRLIQAITDAVFPDTVGEGFEVRGGPRTNVMSLTPGERTNVEEMERKITKLAYKCRIRIVYLAKKNVFNKARGVGPVVGAIKQFNDGTKNYLKVGKKSWTKANYAFKKARVYGRQNSFIRAYAGRDMGAGEAVGGFVLNSEELATIYHFPMASVKAPMVKRTASRKSEPPPTLPIADDITMITVADKPEPPAAESETAPYAPEPSSPAPSSAAAPAPAPSVPPEPTGKVLPVVSDSDIIFVEIPDEK